MELLILVLCFFTRRRLNGRGYSYRYIAQKSFWREGKQIFRFHQITIGNEVYFLRITAEAIEQIEKKLGKAVFSGLENITENFVTTLVTTLWGAMLEMDANFTTEQAASLMDQYIDDGHSLEELMREIDCLLDTGGFFIRGRDSQNKMSR